MRDVSSFMFGDLSQLFEAFAAEAANERFVSRMNSQMVLQIAFLRKLFSAVTTNKYGIKPSRFLIQNLPLQAL